MRGVGVIQDGFAFTEAEIERGAPRFWWGAAKRQAYRRVVERRGIGPARREHDDDRDLDTDGSSRRDDGTAAAAVAAVAMADAFEEKRTDGGGRSFPGSLFDGGSDGGGGSDGSSGSGSSGSDGGAGGSSE